MRNTILFGTGDLARLLRTYLERDTDRHVAAYTLHRRFIDDAAAVDSLPVLPFEDLAALHPPSDTEMFVALGYNGVNRRRADVVEEVRRAGYHLINYISPHAIVPAGLSIGYNSMVLEGTIIQDRVVIGDDVLIWSGCHISHDSSIGHHAYVAPRAALAGRVVVEPYAFVGLNASVRDHVTIGRGAVIGMGSVVLEDVAPDAVLKSDQTASAPIAAHQLRAI